MKPVVIVGAGLAGLTCARRIQERGLRCLLLEARNRVGGRVRTDSLDGFLLDRGFQVLLTSYPEVRRALDLSKLDLRSFEPGALVRRGGSLYPLTDPFRRPVSALRGALAPVGSLRDKLRVAVLRRELTGLSGSELLARPETSTLESLERRGLGSRMIDTFFRPFFGGVFLETSLETSSRWFELLFRLFAVGRTTVPARGMAAIPEQIAADLMPETIRTATPVASVSKSEVTTEAGETIAASAVVLAVEEPVAMDLLGRPCERPWRSVDCLYYALPESPIRGPWLVLNGEGRGLINNLCVPSQASERYAPSSQQLLSVTVVDGSSLEVSEIEAAVAGELVDWFGARASGWRHLRSYRIHHALPAQRPGELLRQRRTEDPSGVYLCGDYCETSSIQGAMVSGRKTADAVLAEHLKLASDLD